MSNEALGTGAIENIDTETTDKKSTSLYSGSDEVNNRRIELRTSSDSLKQSIGEVAFGSVSQLVLPLEFTRASLPETS